MKPPRFSLRFVLLLLTPYVISMALAWHWAAASNHGPPPQSATLVDRAFSCLIATIVWFFVLLAIDVVRTLAPPAALRFSLRNLMLIAVPLIALVTWLLSSADLGLETSDSLEILFLALGGGALVGGLFLALRI
ncbi:hypothetical protein [Lacipirellula parvula]|uniref:Uncharacterized protein n=1 Tax=Lacipirellula parvula TaxID=2650471 RepID=A0A5K7XG19_9BACT|nr:hypothetical protein [Lacipirellula parvula]BBO33183.1 hypothetical protein PLANPX_2795 [Lacipirellula parvula]